jgi:hypothetical protein
VIGFVLGILLIVSPADLAKIRHLPALFNRNTVAMRLRITFRVRAS